MHHRNEHGSIVIDNSVIAKIAGMAAMECPGVIGMAAKSIKDGLVHLLKLESLTKGVKIFPLESGELAVQLRIVVEYGTNLAVIAGTLQSNVRYAVETQAGFKVREVNIFIDGIRI